MRALRPSRPLSRFRRSPTEERGVGAHLSPAQKATYPVWVSPQEAEGQDHAGAHPPCQCAEVEGSQRHRTCVCASEGSAQSDNPHDRPCASPREDRARQPCLQHAALHLAADKIRACLRAQAPRIRLRDNAFHQRLHRNANFKLHHLRANKNRGYWRCGHWACLEPNCLELPKETRPPDRATPSNTCLRNKEANNAAL